MWSQVLIPSCSACLGLELGSRELTGCVSTGLQGLRWQKQRARETTRSTTAGPASRGRLGLTDAPRPMSPPLTSSSGGLRTPAHHLPRLLASWVKHLSFFHQKKKRSFSIFTKKKFLSNYSNLWNISISPPNECFLSWSRVNFPASFVPIIYLFFCILDILYKIKAIAKISNICLKKRAYSYQNVRIRGWINLMCSWAGYGLCWGFIWFSTPLASNIWGISPFSLEEPRVSTSVSFWRFFFFCLLLSCS